MSGREFNKFSKLRFGLLSAAFILGLLFPPLSFSEIYKYVDQDGVVHLSNVPDARHNLVLKEGWVRFRLGANLEQYETLIPIVPLFCHRILV